MAGRVLQQMQAIHTLGFLCPPFGGEYDAGFAKLHATTFVYSAPAWKLGCTRKRCGGDISRKSKPKHPLVWKKYIAHNPWLPRAFHATCKEPRHSSRRRADICVWAYVQAFIIAKDTSSNLYRGSIPCIGVMHSLDLQRGFNLKYRLQLQALVACWAGEGEACYTLFKG